jgi:hypothetical protein
LLHRRLELTNRTTVRRFETSLRLNGVVQNFIQYLATSTVALSVASSPVSSFMASSPNAERIGLRQSSRIVVLGETGMVELSLTEREQSTVSTSCRGSSSQNTVLDHMFGVSPFLQLISRPQKHGFHGNRARRHVLSN